MKISHDNTCHQIANIRREWDKILFRYFAIVNASVHNNACSLLGCGVSITETQLLEPM